MNSPYNGKFKVTQQYKGTSHDGLDLVGIDSKQIHSTVNGTVEKAGWENPIFRNQGFGLYVRILQDNSTNRYYFGHLSSVNVKVGQRVAIGDVIGVEGSTGKSTGSHCHYCIRGYADKRYIKDVSAISGIPNQIGTYDDSVKQPVFHAGVGKVICSSLSVRASSDTKSAILRGLSTNNMFDILEFVNVGGKSWVKVNVVGTVGYLLIQNPNNANEKYIQVLSEPCTK